MIDFAANQWNLPLAPAGDETCIYVYGGRASTYLGSTKRDRTEPRKVQLAAPIPRFWEHNEEVFKQQGKDHRRKTNKQILLARENMADIGGWHVASGPDSQMRALEAASIKLWGFNANQQCRPQGLEKRRKHSKASRRNRRRRGPMRTGC